MYSNIPTGITLSLFLAGFIFGEHETTALIQYEGGPCAVIAPVQAFIVKNMFFSESPKQEFSQVTRKYHSYSY